MSDYIIHERKIPQDLPNFAEDFKAYKSNPSLPNPLLKFVPDEWRERERYSDQPTDDGAPFPLPIDDYLKQITSVHGRIVKAALV